MEFHYNINEIFKSPIVEINHSLIPPGYTGDRRALRDVVSKVSEIVNAMGEASASAQGLTKPITTADRLRNSEHKLYVMVDPNGNGSKGAITGMLKTGNKSLYVFDRDGIHYQVSPPCLLDFYIHESRQRNGLGKKLFEHMLQKEKIEPVQMAIDRPSEKLLSFFNKHYSLNTPVKQMNNYVVYDGFFPSKETVTQASEVDEARSVADSKKNSANGLQYSQAPMGRYGAPRPPCSMGQIIHNQSPSIEQRQEPTGVQSMPGINYQDANFSPQTNAYETKSTPNTYYGNYQTQNWRQDPSFQTYATNNQPYGDPAQLQHVKYQNQSYSMPSNVSYQQTYGQNPQSSPFGQYPHFMTEQHSQLNTTGQGSQMNMPAQQAQMMTHAQPSQMNMPTQPYQMNMPAQPSQMNMHIQPSQMNMPTQPSQMNIPAQPSHMNVPSQPSHINLPPQSSQMNTLAQPSQRITSAQPSQRITSGQPSQRITSAQPPQMMTHAQPSQMNMPTQPSQMNMAGYGSRVNILGQPYQFTGQPSTNVEPPANIGQMYAQPVKMTGYQYQQPGSENWVAGDYRGVQQLISTSKLKLSNGMDLPEPKPESKSKLLRQQQQHQEGVVSSGKHVGHVENVRRQEPLIPYSQSQTIPEQANQHQFLPPNHPHMTQSAVYPTVSGQNSSVQGFKMPHATHTAPNLNAHQYIPSAPYADQSIPQVRTPAPSVQHFENQQHIVQGMEEEREGAGHVMGAGEPKQMINQQLHQPVVDPQYQMHYQQAQRAETGDFKPQIYPQIIPSKPVGPVRHQHAKPVSSKTDLTPNNSQPNYTIPPSHEQNFPYNANSAEYSTQQNYQDHPPNFQDQQVTPVQNVQNESNPTASNYQQPQNLIQQNTQNQMYRQNSVEEYQPISQQPNFHMATQQVSNSDVNSQQLNQIKNLPQENLHHPTQNFQPEGQQKNPHNVQPYFHQPNLEYQNLPTISQSQQHFQQTNPVQQNFQQPEYQTYQLQQNTPSPSPVHQNPQIPSLNAIQPVEQVKSGSVGNMNQGDHAQHHSNSAGHADQSYTVNQAGDYIIQQNQESEKELPKRRVPSAAELFKTDSSEQQSIVRSKAKAKRYYNKLIQPSECDLVYGYPPQINDNVRNTADVIRQQTPQKLERPRSLIIQPGEPIKKEDEQIEEKELEDLGNDPSPVEDVLDSLEMGMGRLDLGQVEKSKVKGTTENFLCGDGDEPSPRKTPSHLTEQGYFDLKFYHNKLW